MNHRNLRPLTLLSLLLLNPFSFAKDSKSALEIPVRIAVIGDRTGGHVPGVYEDVVAEIAALRPDIIFTVGDQIEGYSDDPAVMTAQWDEYDAIVAPIKDKLHLTPGNHDIYSAAQEQFYRQRVGEPYYSLDYRGIHFTVLDVGRWNQASELPMEQMKWLEADLKKASKAERRMVFLHKPFWFYTINQGQPDRLHEIFKANRVDLVMTGHFHFYFSGEFDDVKYISLGSSGGGAQTDPMDVMYQYGWVTVDQEGAHPVVLKKSSVLNWDYMTVGDYHRIYDFQRESFAYDHQLFFEPDLTLKPSQVTLTIKNADIGVVMDTLSWLADEGWRFEPESVNVTLDPSAEQSYTFNVSCDRHTKEIPYFKLKIPFRSDRSASVDHPLDLTRLTRAAKVAAAPQIDGYLSEWLNAWETLFYYGRANPLPEGATRIAFSHDDANLYLAGSAAFPPDYQLKADATGRDSAVYGDDCFGFFFCPDTAVGAVYQIYINPLGVIFDQKITFGEGGSVTQDKTWNGKFKVKTSVNPEGWTMEARIPYSELGITDEAGENWKVNFRRKMPGFKENADWIQPVNYDPNYFGVLRLE